jgi:hypothetical protein
LHASRFYVSCCPILSGIYRISPLIKYDPAGGQVSQKLSLVAAARFAGCSEKTLSRRAKEGKIRTYEDPLDKRKVLFDPRDLKRLKKPQPRAQG